METLNLRQPDLTVITDEVHKGRNLSAIVRTCDAVGIDTVHTVTPRAGYRGFRGTASGSHKWVHVEVHDDIDNALSLAKACDMQVVAAALGPTSLSYLDIDYTQPTAVLLGSEKAGVGAKALASADALIQVPMVGMVESLNVSVAAAIILQEAFRQRQNAGLYGTNKLPDDILKRRFFRWAHPAVAEYCDAKNIEYPNVSDEDGEIINSSQWYQSVK